MIDCLSSEKWQAFGGPVLSEEEQEALLLEKIKQTKVYIKTSILFIILIIESLERKERVEIEMVWVGRKREFMLHIVLYVSIMLLLSF